MIKVAKTNTSYAEGPCSIKHYLDCVVEEPRIGAYENSIENGNHLDLLKLVTEKLVAAKLISEQELLDTLGGNYEWQNLYFKAAE